MSTVISGQHGEDAARGYLLELGWKIVERNWRCSAGEIDIIAVDPTGPVPTMVVVEVKFRTGNGYGRPLEAITFTKRRHLRSSCALWLAGHDWAGPVRLDGLGIVKRRGSAPQFQHVRAIS